MFPERRRALPKRAELRRFAAWIVALAALVIQAILAHRTTFFGQDFSQVHTATLGLVRSGNPYVHSQYLDFVYPPSSALALLPIGALPQTLSVDAGLLLVMASLVIVAGGCGRLTGRRFFSTASAVILLGIVISGPGRGALLGVNISALSAAVVVLVAILADRRRWLAASLVFAAGVAVKPLTAPGLLMFLAARRWRAATLAVALPIVVNLAILPFLGDPLHFLDVTLPQLLTGHELAPEFNSALRTVGQRKGLPSGLILVVRLCVVMSLAAFWRPLRQLPTTETIVVGLAAPILVVALAGATDENHFGLVALPILALGLFSGRLITVAAASFATLFLLIPGSSLPGTVSLGPGITTIGQLMVVLLSVMLSTESSRCVPAWISSRRSKAPAVRESEAKPQTATLAG